MSKRTEIRQIRALHLFLPIFFKFDCNLTLLKCNPVLKNQYSVTWTAKLHYPTAQILPLYQGKKDTAMNYCCTSPFPRSWELEEKNCYYAAKLKVLCKLAIGTLQLSYFQGWSFKGLVELILFQFLFMDFPLSGKFKLIKCFSIACAHWKLTTWKISEWQGVYMGNSHEQCAL